METTHLRRWMSWRIALGLAAILVGIYIARPRPAIPRDNTAAALAGEYTIHANTGLQIPEIFRGRVLIIRDSADGRATATNERGRKLDLIQRDDGLFFNEQFLPVGPAIPLGITKNFNEGLLRKIPGGIVIEGKMRETGMSVFGPVDDSTTWRVQLTRITANVAAE